MQGAVKSCMLQLQPSYGPVYTEHSVQALLYGGPLGLLRQCEPVCICQQHVRRKSMNRLCNTA